VREQTSNKKPFKLGKANLIDPMIKMPEGCNDFFTSSGSLVESYKGGNVGIRFSLLNVDERPDLSIIFRFDGSRINSFSSEHDGREILSGHSRNSCNQDVPMLIDVGEFIQYVEIMPSESGNSTWLKEANQGPRIRDYSPKTTTLNCLVETLGRSANGEGLFFGGLSRLQDEFPHQVIQSGSEVLQSIAHDQCNIVGNRNINFDLEERILRGAVWMRHGFCWVQGIVGLQFGFKRLEVDISLTIFRNSVRLGAVRSFFLLSDLAMRDSPP